MAEIRVKGAEELARKFGGVRVVQVLKPPFERGTARLQRALAKYPSRRSRYRRTGTLGRRWTTEVSGGGGEIRGLVGNNTMYAPYVQGDATQARMHAGIWQTDDEVAKEERAAIEKDIAKAIVEALE